MIRAERRRGIHELNAMLLKLERAGVYTVGESIRARGGWARIYRRRRKRSAK